MAKEQKFLKTVDGVHRNSYMIITGVNIWVCLDSDHVSGVRQKSDDNRYGLHVGRGMVVRCLSCLEQVLNK